MGDYPAPPFTCFEEGVKIGDIKPYNIKGLSMLWLANAIAIYLTGGIYPIPSTSK
ncbi:MAG: hypothetical protein LVQ97_02860 [Candidatus Micrarchaeales archaeon]|jgi:hypothetical protein|nr:hypothetical protein [Candidatus Micrarchaeales archaeon]